MRKVIITNINKEKKQKIIRNIKKKQKKKK